MRTLFALISLSCSLLAAAAPYHPISVAVRAQQVGAHSYYLPGLSGAASLENEGFMSNAGFVVTAEGVVVFDTLGSPSLAWEMLQRIREVTSLPIKRVIVSHYHADHYYGIQVFKDAGAEIWAHEAAREVVGSQDGRLRLEQRKELLGRWINDATQRFPVPDRWLSGDNDFELGGLHFQIRHVGPAHSQEDMVMFVREDAGLFAGDLIFKGRVPFIGDADSRLWLAALDKLIAFQPSVLVPGHGEVSTDPITDLTLTRDYLRYVRAQMGRAVEAMTPFDEAYAGTDWSKYENMPAFSEANRRNAYNTYLLMEREGLAK